MGLGSCLGVFLFDSRLGEGPGILICTEGLSLADPSDPYLLTSLD